jgi:hypothetical protein
MPFPASTNMGSGQCMGTPDTCLTPAPPAPPVPVPYPNIGMLSQSNPGTCGKKVLIENGMSVTLGTKTLMSSGDEAGANMGVASGMIKGPNGFLVGAMTVIVEGNPLVRMTSTATHNGASANFPAGTIIAPSATKTLVP